MGDRRGYGWDLGDRAVWGRGSVGRGGCRGRCSCRGGSRGRDRDGRRGRGGGYYMTGL